MTEPEDEFQVVWVLVTNPKRETFPARLCGDGMSKAGVFSFYLNPEDAPPGEEPGKRCEFYRPVHPERPPYEVRRIDLPAASGTPKTMRWNAADRWSFLPAQTFDHQQIVAWVNANGGEARYEPRIQAAYGGNGNDRAPRIAVRTKDGWVYASPGDTVVMGKETWMEGHSDDPNLDRMTYREVREFTVEQQR